MAEPKPTTDPSGISCVANCQPEYPAALDGEEGSASIRLTIAPEGKVIGANLTTPHSNPMLNRQALLAARQMKFSEIDNEAGASVVVKINFTVEGSEFDNLARERQERLEQERQAKLEAERQQKLEAQRKEKLEQERQAKLEAEKKLQEEQQQQAAPETENSEPLTPEELEAERLRKFRERLEKLK